MTRVYPGGQPAVEAPSVSSLAADIARLAKTTAYSEARTVLIQAQIKHLHNPEVWCVLRDCIAQIRQLEASEVRA